MVSDIWVETDFPGTERRQSGLGRRFSRIVTRSLVLRTSGSMKRIALLAAFLSTQAPFECPGKVSVLSARVVRDSGASLGEVYRGVPADANTWVSGDVAVWVVGNALVEFGLVLPFKLRKHLWAFLQAATVLPVADAARLRSALLVARELCDVAPPVSAQKLPRGVREEVDVVRLGKSVVPRFVDGAGGGVSQVGRVGGTVPKRGVPEAAAPTQPGRGACFSSTCRREFDARLLAESESGIGAEPRRVGGRATAG